MWPLLHQASFTFHYQFNSKVLFLVAQQFTMHCSFETLLLYKLIGWLMAIQIWKILSMCNLEPKLCSWARKYIYKKIIVSLLKLKQYQCKMCRLLLVFMVLYWRRLLMTIVCIYITHNTIMHCRYCVFWKRVDMQRLYNCTPSMLVD